MDSNLIPPCPPFAWFHPLHHPLRERQQVLRRAEQARVARHAVHRAAFSSCTSPRSTRPRQGSSSVGAIRASPPRSADSGLRSCRAAERPGAASSESSRSWYTASTAWVRTIAPRSEYDLRRAGRRAQRGAVGQGEGLRPGLRLPEQRPPGGQAARVGQQQADGDPLLSCAGECRHVSLHRCIQLQLPLVHGEHRPPW